MHTFLISLDGEPYTRPHSGDLLPLSKCYFDTNATRKRRQRLISGWPASNIVYLIGWVESHSSCGISRAHRDCTSSVGSELWHWGGRFGMSSLSWMFLHCSYNILPEWNESHSSDSLHGPYWRFGTACTKTMLLAGQRPGLYCVLHGWTLIWCIKKGMEPIHYAAENGNLHILNMLLEQGCDMESETKVSIH